MSFQSSGMVTIASPWFSRIWQFSDNRCPFARATRNVAHRTSHITLDDGRTRLITPDGWGTIRLLEGDSILATAERSDFLGQTWELRSDRFTYELKSESTIRRHWTIGPIGSPFADLRGGILSFNSMTLDSGLPIPFDAVVLTWQAITRPWEAAATGIGPAA